MADRITFGCYVPMDGDLRRALTRAPGLRSAAASRGGVPPAAVPYATAPVMIATAAGPSPDVSTWWQMAFDVSRRKRRREHPVDLEVVAPHHREPTAAAMRDLTIQRDFSLTLQAAPFDRLTLSERTHEALRAAAMKGV